ncbi:enoyl-CoA hydratase/isomerase family protein [Hellea sp.]|jgi:enoyl-CoA hydratase|nr:enoyl-CoA hydratase/isomerase family protein [Hellea sp.]MBT3593406.1 enoyl-CoA hydratase/isomerase family protein [Hellea sp.]MBT5835942.1 enoyl-CoA hydratase/isomerase family protein [Hellea sp.]MBT7398811.1 enoyl-CoA hydratase/isomerase family protein [Hellea sp.]MDA8888214.1 enoyl-CoA hydratase/isomerase family protein [Hellea sp.]MDB4844004.1 enoyl-CoA hydratase/isomerase family protein [Hellea sp.]
MNNNILTEYSDKILTITLNRPEKLNALSPNLLQELKAELDEASTNDAISVVIIKSTGRAFCVGYDLNEENWITSQYPANYPKGIDIELDKKDIMALLDYWIEVWKFPKPIICQVQGACLSGAGELLAVSDIVIASKKATFGHPAGRDLGIPPTVFFWPLTIGMRKTKEMLYTAKSMDADEAEKLGLINQAVNPDNLESKTRNLALNIAKTPVNHLMILKKATNNFYDNMNLEKSVRQASDLDAEFHQSPTFLSFFRLVSTKGMKAALAERARLFN